MSADNSRKNREQELNTGDNAIANETYVNPVLDELLRKRRAKIFLLVVLIIFVIVFLIFILPVKQGEVRRTYQAYDFISDKEIGLELNIWQERRILGENEINGHITFYSDYEKKDQKSLMFTGQSAYDIYIQNRELQRNELPESAQKVDRIEAGLEANAEHVNDEIKVSSRYSYLYADNDLQNLIFIGDAQNDEDDIFIVARLDDKIEYFEIIKKMRDNIGLYKKDNDFIREIMGQ